MVINTGKGSLIFLVTSGIIAIGYYLYIFIPEGLHPDEALSSEHLYPKPSSNRLHQFVLSNKTDKHEENIRSNKIITHMKTNISKQEEKRISDKRWHLLKNMQATLEKKCVELDNIYKNLSIKKNPDICKRFKLEAKRPRPIFKSPYSHLNVYPKGSVSLVASLTPSRFDTFEHVMEYWQGPLSIPVYLECTANFTAIMQRMHTWMSEDALDIHFVLGNYGEFYPFTYLRNVGLKHAKTEYVFLNDIDYVPKWQLQNLLREKILQKQMQFDKKQLYIVPPFEFQGQETMEVYPQSKQELIKLWNKKTIDVFRYNIGYYAAHKNTNFTKWKTASQIYEAKYEFAFEPYVVGKIKDLPYYCEELVGRFYDKISHMEELHARGFRFYVLPDTYEIHMPHSRPAKKDRVKYYKCADAVYNRFKSRLKLIKKS